MRNPDKYNGKVVVVEGTASSIKIKFSTQGKPYTIFKITQGRETLNVFTHGELPIRNGDHIRVAGIYQKVKFVPPKSTFHNGIDASHGGVEKM